MPPSKKEKTWGLPQTGCTYIPHHGRGADVWLEGGSEGDERANGAQGALGREKKARGGDGGYVEGAGEGEGAETTGGVCREARAGEGVAATRSRVRGGGTCQGPEDHAMGRGRNEPVVGRGGAVDPAWGDGRGEDGSAEAHVRFD